MMAGVYANFANVSHSEYEFSITFVRLEHEGEEPDEMNGVVVSRVNLSPKFMKELTGRHGRQLQQVAGGGEHPEPAGGPRATSAVPFAGASASPAGAAGPAAAEARRPPRSGGPECPSGPASAPPFRPLCRPFVAAARPVG